jgi:multidrug resistance efflux pump
MASDPPQAPASPRKWSLRMREWSLRSWVIILLCIGVVIYFGGDYVVAYTNDAYVQSDFVPIASEAATYSLKFAVMRNRLASARPINGEPTLA